MFFKLLILMILIPAAEVILLVKSGQTIGLANTFAVIVLTGILGAAISKREGAHSWRAVRETAAAGKLPARELVESVLVLAAGLVLLTPGFITDAVGFALMIRPIRRFVAQRLVKRYSKNLKFSSTGFSANYSANFHAGTRRPGDNPNDPIDVQAREINDPAIDDGGGIGNR